MNLLCLNAIIWQMARSTTLCAHNVISYIFLLWTLPVAMLDWSTIPASTRNGRSCHWHSKMGKSLKKQSVNPATPFVGMFRNIFTKLSQPRVSVNKTKSSYLRISSSRKVPFNAASSLSCILFKSFCPSGASMPCFKISRIYHKVHIPKTLL